MGGLLACRVGNVDVDIEVEGVGVDVVIGAR